MTETERLSEKSLKLLVTFKFSFSCLQKARANSFCLLYEPCLFKRASFLPTDWHALSLFICWELLFLLLLSNCTFLICTLWVERLSWTPVQTFVEPEGKVTADLFLLSSTVFWGHDVCCKSGLKGSGGYVWFLCVSWDVHCGSGWALPPSSTLWRGGTPSGIMSFTRTKQRRRSYSDTTLNTLY